MNKNSKDNLNLLTIGIVSLLIFGLVWNWNGGSILIKSAVDKTLNYGVEVQAGEQDKIFLCSDGTDNYQFKNSAGDVIRSGSIGDDFWNDVNKSSRNGLNNMMKGKTLQQGLVFTIIGCLVVVGYVLSAVVVADAVYRDRDERLHIDQGTIIDRCEKSITDDKIKELFEKLSIDSYYIPWTGIRLEEYVGREGAAVLSNQVWAFPGLGTAPPDEKRLIRFFQLLYATCPEIYMALINRETDAYNNFMTDLLDQEGQDFLSRNDFPTSGETYVNYLRLELAMAARDQAVLFEELQDPNLSDDELKKLAEKIGENTEDMKRFETRINENPQTAHSKLLEGDRRRKFLPTPQELVEEYMKSGPIPGRLAPEGHGESTSKGEAIKTGSSESFQSELELPKPTVPADAVEVAPGRYYFE
jgi:hypothetical protein